MTCNDIDECALGTHVCSADATCINTAGAYDATKGGSYDCTCSRAGYWGDGIQCGDVVDLHFPVERFRELLHLTTELHQQISGQSQTVVLLEHKAYPTLARLTVHTDGFFVRAADVCRINR